MIIKTSNKHFQTVDIILAEIELDEKPSIDIIIVETEDKIYRYKIIQNEFNQLYYVVTD